MGVGPDVAEANVEVAGQPVARGFSNCLGSDWSHRTTAAATTKSAACAGTTGSIGATWRIRAAGRSAASASTKTAKSSAPTSHPHEIHGELQCVAAAFGLDFISSFLEVVAANGPAVFPKQRANVQHASTAAVQIRLVMTGEFLHAVAEVHEAEVAKPDKANTGGRNALAPAFDHVVAKVVQVGTRGRLGAAHAEIVGGVRAVAAGAVGPKKIIPSVV